MGQKVKHWEPKLIAKINSILYTPFEWGIMDCALLSAICYDAMTDNKEGLEEWLILQYSNEKSALVMQKKVSVQSWLIEHDAEEIDINFQQVGDFITFETDKALLTSGINLGVCCLVVDQHNGVSIINYKLLPPIKTILRIL